MRAGRTSLITARDHGLCVGDVIDIGGSLHEVTAVTRDSFAAARIGILGRLWLWGRSMFRFRGFWARVWNR